VSGAKGILFAAVAIWIAAVLEQSISPRMSIFGAQPDFLLTVLACLCMFASRIGGALLGFFTGLAAGSITGANLSQFIFSRTITGFADAWSRTMGLDSNVVTAAINAAVVTIASQLILMFFAPPAGIATFVGATIGSAMVNGVLAMPVHALLRRILAP
jgi:hypothetical protein